MEVGVGVGVLMLDCFPLEGLEEKIQASVYHVSTYLLWLLLESNT